MKKIFLTIVAAIFVLGLHAQTVSTAYMTLTYCQPNTDGTKVETICNTDLPYTWETKHGDIEVTASDIVDGHIIKHVEYDRDGVAGCKDYYDMDLTVQTCVPTGAINGLFSVNGEGKKIYFSKGNLIYSDYLDDGATDATHTAYNPITKKEISGTQGRFRFAANQWDMITYETKYNTYLKKNIVVPVSSGKWYDIFAWGTSDMYVTNLANAETFTLKFPLYFTSIPDNASDLKNGFYLGEWKSTYDVGLCNPIENGGNQYGLWRQITQSEWDYLIARNSGSLRARCQVNKIFGLVVLPDNWSWGSGAQDDLIPESWDYTNSGYNNTYSGDQWEAMEANGAVFLPATGYVDYNGNNNTGNSNSSNIVYHTSTYYDINHYTAAYIPYDSYSSSSSVYVSFFYPIRLVQDAK